MALNQLQEDIKISGTYSMLQEVELECLSAKAGSSSLPEGAILCAGVWKGGDIVAINEGLKLANRNREIIVIDSFDGVAEPNKEDLDSDYPVHKGELSPFGIDNFDKTMELFGVKNLHIYKLWITKESLSFVEKRKLAMIWLDLDHYEPALACMQTFFPWLSKDGLMMVHDYAFYRTPGVKKAADEFGGQWIHCAGGIWGLRK